MFAEMYETPDGTYLRLADETETLGTVRMSDDEMTMWLDVRGILQRIRHEADGDWQRLADYTNPVYRINLRPY